METGEHATEEYPFFPSLLEPGKQEADQLLNHFKEKMKQIAQDTLDEIYTDVAVFIESDSWTNYRNKIMDGFRNYKNVLKAPHDFKEIRQTILKEHRDELIKDLNQDLLEEVARLKEHITFLDRMISRR